MKNHVMTVLLIAGLFFANLAFGGEQFVTPPSLTQEDVAALNPQPSAEATELVQRLRDRDVEFVTADNRLPTSEIIPAEEVVRLSQANPNQPVQRGQAVNNNKEQKVGNWTVTHTNESSLYTIRNSNGDSLALICKDGVLLSTARLGRKTYQSGNPQQQIVVQFNNDPDRVLLQSDWEQSPKILWIAFRINTVFSISSLDDPAQYKFDNVGGRRVASLAQADPECIQQ